MNTNLTRGRIYVKVTTIIQNVVFRVSGTQRYNSLIIQLERGVIIIH